MAAALLRRPLLRRSASRTSCLETTQDGFSSHAFRLCTIKNVLINGRSVLTSPGTEISCICIDAGPVNDVVAVTSRIGLSSTIEGGTGNDRLSGGSGHDTLPGDAGRDILFGSWGNDTLFGGLGDDALDGGVGFNSLNAGLGFDTLCITRFFDVYNTGPGRKRIFWR